MLAAVQARAVAGAPLGLQGVEELHRTMGGVAMLTAYFEDVPWPGRGRERARWPSPFEPALRDLTAPGSASLRERIGALEVPRDDVCPVLRALAARRDAVRFLPPG